VVKVLAGDSYGYAGADAPACEALFNQPKAVAIDDDGRIFTIDQRNQLVRKIDVDPDRTITTVVGTAGESGYEGDGGLAIDAKIAMDGGTTPIPTGALALHDGYLYLADSLNNRIRRVDLETGMIECIAGDGERAYRGDGGSALDASFAAPVDIEFGPDGRLYVADTFNNAIRAIDLDADVVETVAGNGQQCGDALFDCYEEEEGVPADQLQLLMPNGIAFDAAGDLYIADSYNNRIVRVAQ
jgi:hypothetical protein